MQRTAYASDAWLLEGLTRSRPGWLEWNAERLRFVTPAEVVFDVPRADITNIRYPWHYFGGGITLHVAGTPRRLSFVKPNGAEYAAGRALGATGNPLALAVPVIKILDIRSGRNVCRRWREILGEGS